MLLKNECEGNINISYLYIHLEMLEN